MAKSFKMIQRIVFEGLETYFGPYKVGRSRFSGTKKVKKAPIFKHECDFLGGWLKVLYILKYASNRARTYGHREEKRWELCF